MATAADIDHLNDAISLALKGRGAVSPNPMVGAILVKGRGVVGRGFHAGPGRPHAETLAIRKAGATARGSTLYVNLEPCSHTGRTGPCTTAIINAGIKRVVASVQDPNPTVNGRGFRTLRKAGIKVEVGSMRREAIMLNDAYFGYYHNSRPFIVVKTAQTLDGRIATATGDSRWISSESSRQYAHQLRADADGVIVGMGTVRTDNPALTVRHVRGENPYRIVLSGSLRFPSKCALLDNNDDFRTIVAGPEKEIERFGRTRKAKGIILWKVRRDRRGFLDLQDFLKRADDFGLRSLLVEGGSRIVTSFMKAKLVDKYVAIVAPLLLGKGVEAVGDLNIKQIAGAIRLENVSFGSDGPDCHVVGYPRWEEN